MGDPINPYAAPRSLDDEPVAEIYADNFRDATSGTRFGNLVGDSVVAFILGLVITLMLRDVMGPGAAWVSLALRPCYYVFFETVFQQTPGKMVTGSRVITESGGKPTFGQIVKRTLIRFIPFEPFSFLGSNGGWHDRWSKTRVVMR